MPTSELPPLPGEPLPPNAVVVKPPTPEEEVNLWSPEEEDTPPEELPVEVAHASPDEALELESEGYQPPPGYKTLRPRQRRVVRMAFAGVVYRQIAHQLGYTLETVRLIMRSPEGKHYLNFLYTRADAETFRCDVQTMFQHNSLAAAAALVAPLANPKADARLRHEAAKAILEFAGHRPAANTNINLNTSALTKDDLTRLSAVDAQLASLKQAAQEPPPHVPDQSGEAGVSPAS